MLFQNPSWYPLRPIYPKPKPADPTPLPKPSENEGPDFDNEKGR